MSGNHMVCLVTMWWIWWLFYVSGDHLISQRTMYVGLMCLVAICLVKMICLGKLFCVWWWLWLQCNSSDDNSSGDYLMCLITLYLVSMRCLLWQCNMCLMTMVCLVTSYLSGDNLMSLVCMGCVRSQCDMFCVWQCDVWVLCGLMLSVTMWCVWWLCYLPGDHEAWLGTMIYSVW